MKKLITTIAALFVLVVAQDCNRIGTEPVYNRNSEPRCTTGTLGTDESKGAWVCWQ